MTRHRRQEKPDRLLVGLKIATVVAAAGLVGLTIMWASGGESGEATPRPTSPKPAITQPSDDGPTTTTTTTPPSLRMDPPALRTETSTIALQPPPASSTPKPRPTTRPPQEPGPGFAVIGKPCPEPGVWSVTSDYEPVICASNPPGRQLRWTPVF